MDQVTPIIRSRKRRRTQTQKNPLGRTGMGIALVVSIVVAAGMIAGAFLFTRIAQDLPNPERLAQLLDPEAGLLYTPTVLMDRSGSEVLYRVHPLAEETRNPVRLAGDQQLPPHVFQAAVTAADPGYWSHTTWDLLSDRLEGDRSLSQQLVSTFLFWSEEPGPIRDLRERLVTAQVLSQYGREQVLEWYLNSAHYGYDAYGLETAAQLYFGVAASELNPAQAALLAVVGEAPALNPFDAPQAARERQVELLHTMVAKGHLTSEEVQELKAIPLEYREPPPALREEPAFLNMALQQASRVIPESRLRQGGFVITTTLDADLQAQASCALAFQREQYARGAAQPDPECEAARLLPAFANASQQLPDREALSAKTMILDPATGQVLALSGSGSQGAGSNWDDEHPPGSILTPFLYLAAFTRGNEPASLVWDIPQDDGLSAQETHPNCDENCQYHGPVRTRIALANDYLRPAFRTWEKVGAASALNLFQQLGLQTLDTACPDCDLWWEGQEVPLADLAQAYGILSNRGNLVGVPPEEPGPGKLAPVLILRLEDVSGLTWMEQPPAVNRSVISHELAYLLTHALRDETARWPSLGPQNVLEIGRPVGVKMGYVREENAHWTVGYTPQRVVAVWVGEDLAAGERTPWSRQAAPGIWRALTQYASRDLPAVDWETPPGITIREVCDPSGMLPTEHCPKTVQEVFISGSGPTQPDTLYQVRQVNRDTGRLATVFTPPELIEERVYLIVPPEAAEWAAAEELPTPPENYDVSYQPAFTENLKITSPENFSYVRNQVSIQGTIRGEDFRSYYLQVGRGLNPEVWRRYGEEHPERVFQSLIETWDTTDLEDGLYALQLVVLKDKQRVEKVAVLVSVDNTPPAITIPDLEEGDLLTYDDGDRLTFQAEVADNGEIEAVEFYLGSSLLASREEPPYGVTWRMRAGTYSLRVVARDKAGNETEQTIEFEVEPE